MRSAMRIATFLLLVCACAPAPPPPVLGQVPAFDLVDHTGAHVTRETLLGRPWVADFVFTRCTAICPRMTERMTALARSHRGDAVRFVSVSVDPEHDTPEVLARYVSRFRPEPSWHFLTGDLAAIRSLSIDGFKLAYERSDDPAIAAGEAVMHSNRFVLVDAEGAIRGYYDAFDPAELDRLERELGALLDAR